MKTIFRKTFFWIADTVWHVSVAEGGGSRFQRNVRTCFVDIRLAGHSKSHPTDRNVNDGWKSNISASDSRQHVL